MAEQRFDLATLAPFSLVRYARAKGWSEVPNVDPQLWLFSDPQHPLRQLMVPRDPRDSAWPRAVGDALQRLAESEGRHSSDVAEDLANLDADVVCVRVDTPRGARGSVGVAYDLTLREAIRRSILAVACLVQNPATFHARLSQADADALLASCTTTTTPGSYLVKVRCPLERDSQSSLFDRAPFARQVTQHLMRAVAALVDFIEHDGRDLDGFVTRQQEAPQLSANLCDALSRLQPEDDSAVELSVRWSAELAPTAPLAPLRLQRDYFAVIGELANRMRPQRSERSVEPLIGTVEALNGGVGDDGRRSGEVTLVLLLPDSGEQVKARVTLGADDYARAIEAHQRGRGYVQVIGQLVRGQKQNRVVQVQGFRTVPSE